MQTTYHMRNGWTHTANIEAGTENRQFCQSCFEFFQQCFPYDWYHTKIKWSEKHIKRYWFENQAEFRYYIWKNSKTCNIIINNWFDTLYILLFGSKNIDKWIVQLQLFLKLNNWHQIHIILNLKWEGQCIVSTKILMICWNLFIHLAKLFYLILRLDELQCKEC